MARSRTVERGFDMTNRISADDAILLVIDLQERLLPVMHRRDDLVRRITTALYGAHALSIPVIATEQYPKGLGSTVAEIASALDRAPIHEKIEFSALAAPAVAQSLADGARRTVLVVGIEAHVCVLQTCLDLVDAGYQPVLLRDCVSSRHPHDRDAGIDRIAGCGAVVTTVESALFEMLARAGTDTFRTISKLVREL
ncbi:MAG: isochorismatase family protein [Spirochaetaceae bacterium]|nr:MAG: isochorismatase family protein [Spirochaetaceae bacterium]